MQSERKREPNGTAMKRIRKLERKKATWPSSKICALVPLSTPNQTSFGNFTYGELGASILETWGKVRSPDVFRIAFPDKAQLDSFAYKWGYVKDPRLIVVKKSSYRATFPQLPSTVRTLELIHRAFGRLGCGKRPLRRNMTGACCSWYVVADIDGYVNLNALRNQLKFYSPEKPILVGSTSLRSPHWNSSWYSYWWTTGATGHVLSRALVHTVDWRLCQQELWDRKQQKLQVVGHDDVEIAGCIHRRLINNYTVQFVWKNLWTMDGVPNTNVSTMIARRDPKWARVATAHRMTPSLNYASAKLLSKLAYPSDDIFNDASPSIPVLAYMLLIGAFVKAIPSIFP